MRVKWLTLTLVMALANLGTAEKAIEISKSEHQLRIVEDGKILHTYACAIGRGSEGRKEKIGDNKTPEGDYRIVAIKKPSGFHLFLHLSYPNLADIENGHMKRLISDSLYQAMKAEIETGKLPIQTTALGGYVGIHGIKNGLGWLGSLQSKIDWTQGCIAVTNEEIEEISKEIRIGTRVSIKP
jgi:murein L,D-transpeptidase YafK